MRQLVEELFTVTTGAWGVLGVALCVYGVTIGEVYTIALSAWIASLCGFTFLARLEAGKVAIKVNQRKVEDDDEVEHNDDLFAPRAFNVRPSEN